MKLEKAKEILTLEVISKPIPWEEDFSNAVKLGIEAQKRLEDWRQGKVLNPDLLLPGETED